MLHSRKIRKTKTSNMRKEGHCEAAVFLFCVLVQNGRVSLAKRGNLACPAGAQEGRHLRFPPSCESPLSLGGSGADCRHVTAAKWGNGRGFFLCCGRTTFGVRPLEQPVRSVRYRTATQVGYFQQARHDSAAQLVSLEFADSTYGLGVRCNLSSQVPCVTTCQGFARHGYVAPA